MRLPLIISEFLRGVFKISFRQKFISAEKVTGGTSSSPRITAHDRTTGNENVADDATFRRDDTAEVSWDSGEEALEFVDDGV